MEAGADAFAVDHLCAHFQRGLVSSTAVLLFVLFAHSPELLNEYPFCPNADTHPHPLRRLCWVLRRVYPDDRACQLRYFNTAAKLLMSSLEPAGFDTKGWHDALYYSAFCTDAAPHLDLYERP